MSIDWPFALAQERPSTVKGVTKVGCLSEGRMYYRVRERESFVRYRAACGVVPPFAYQKS